jgi:hypothetical protein
VARPPLRDSLEDRIDERDRAADEREQIADERERLADERDKEADQRDKTADRREKAADDATVRRTGDSASSTRWRDAASGLGEPAAQQLWRLAARCQTAARAWRMVCARIRWRIEARRTARARQRCMITASRSIGLTGPIVQTVSAITAGGTVQRWIRPRSERRKTKRSSATPTRRSRQSAPN